MQMKCLVNFAYLLNYDPSIMYAIVFDSVLCNKVCNLLDTLGNVASEQGVQNWTRPGVVAKSSHERIY